MPPLVSILLPTYSRYRTGFLTKAVDSVLSQEYSNLELWIVDDASVDGTCTYAIEAVAADSRVNHLRMAENVGLPAKTLAQAFLQSKGEYIGFNFDDTLLTADCLSTLMAEFDRNQNLDMVYGSMKMHMPDGITTYGEQPDLKILQKGNFIGNASVLLKRSAFKKCGWYDPNILLKRSCDWDLWLRAFEKLEVSFVDRVVSNEYGQSLSDSFRRSHYLFDDLVRKYMAFERSALLTPENVAKADFPVDSIPFQLSATEAEQYDLACLEHYVRTLNQEKVVDTVKRMLDRSDRNLGEFAIRIGYSQSTALADSTLSFLGSAFYYSTKLMESQNQLYELEGKLSATNEELGALKDVHHDLLRSISWRITAPLRDLKSKYSQYVSR